ncbi:hypothetical protein EJ02DRAFT_439412 [Clathrospora elynae]|uniref:Uncharacterized protein n=1 Tax=Clathrospora elynae TaxID=706981 RepID=A0A6A5SCK2_9PLEO|nr:hypothetical protein EJ02DRAFT_439412 [Clathrospora elynae]
MAAQIASPIGGPSSLFLGSGSATGSSIHAIKSARFMPIRYSSHCVRSTHGFASSHSPKSSTKRHKRAVGTEVITAVDLIRDPHEISTFPVSQSLATRIGTKTIPVQSSGSNAHGKKLGEIEQTTSLDASSY